MSSVVQMRGSIPLFWSQETSRFSPKPDFLPLILQRYDPTYEASRLHFEDLSERYGNPIIVLNLIKTVEKRQREMMLRREFHSAVGYLNQILPEESQIKFIHWDFHKFAKGFFYSGKQSFVKRVGGQLSRTSTGSAVTLTKQHKELEISQSSSLEPQFQSGVLRTNCIDCLDRTNVAQYAYGCAALGLTDDPKVDPDSSIAVAVMDMYQSMGDALAHQYGGSAAHNTVFPERQGKWKATTQSREFLKSIKRYYCNTCTDGEKQDAINLFLGYFQPQDGKPAIWDLENSDYYLHLSRIGDDLVPMRIIALYKRIQYPVVGTSLAPIPACQENFSRMKLTSFDRLIERTCSLIKNVRFCCEFDQKSGNSGVAPDAAEIQLKSPNWLFGQRKIEKTAQHLKLLLMELQTVVLMMRRKPLIYQTSAYFLPLSIAVKGISRTSTLQCQRSMRQTDGMEVLYSVIVMKTVLFIKTVLGSFRVHPWNLLEVTQREKYYSDLLLLNKVDYSMDDDAEAKMDAALREYDSASTDLGIFPKSCRVQVNDPSALLLLIV